MLRTCVCEKCGLAFERETCGKAVPRFCSASCRNSANAARADKRALNYGEAKCASCGKYYTKRSRQQLYCGQPCADRASRARNIEKHRERDRVKVSKLRIGRNIRDETLKTPSKDAKWLWDGVGRWSWKYWPDIKECLECGTTVYRHQGNGVCERCYDRLRPRDPEEVREWKKRAYERAREAGKPTSAGTARSWIRKAKEGEIPVTPTIENLLENLEQL